MGGYRVPQGDDYHYAIDWQVVETRLSNQKLQSPDSAAAVLRENAHENIDRGRYGRHQRRDHLGPGHTQDMQSNARFAS